MAVATRRPGIRMDDGKNAAMDGAAREAVEESWGGIAPSCPDHRGGECPIADGECAPGSCPKLREQVRLRQLEDAADGGEEWGP